MNTITFKYREKPIVCNAPSVWNEVERKQLLLWVALMYSTISEELKLAMAVSVFYKVRLKIFLAMRDSQRLQIAPSLRTLLKNNRLNIWVIKSVRLGWLKFYGPADKLSNITAHEFFNVCDPLYFKYKLNGSTEALNALCAALYRPKRKGIVFDDIREDLTDAGIAKRARLFKYINLNTRRAIAFNYEGCRNFITSMKDHRAAFSGSDNRSKKRGDVTLSIAGGALGDLEKTRKTNLYTFLMHLVNLIEQEEEIKNK